MILRSPVSGAQGEFRRDASILPDYPAHVRNKLRKFLLSFKYGHYHPHPSAQSDFPHPKVPVGPYPISSREAAYIPHPISSELARVYPISSELARDYPLSSEPASDYPAA